MIAVMPHEEVGKVIASLFRPFSRDTYNLIFMLSSVGGLLGYLYMVYKNLNKSFSKLVVGYLVLNMVLAVACFKVLFVLNVEAIHFLQYSIFAILCFSYVKNYSLTLAYTTIAGAIDEAYQFYYLAPERTEYYDFNDVIINLIGGVFGLILVRSLNLPTYKYTFREFIKSGHFKILLGVLACIVALFASGLLVKNYDAQNLHAKFWLIRTSVEGFWQDRPQFNFRYHIVQPWEGIGIVALLLLIYSRLYQGVPILNKSR